MTHKKNTIQKDKKLLVDYVKFIFAGKNPYLKSMFYSGDFLMLKIDEFLSTKENK